MDGLRFLWRHDEIMESLNPLTSEKQKIILQHNVHHTTPITISCSDAPITELVDFPINRYLMAGNSRYRSDMLIFIKIIKN